MKTRAVSLITMLLLTCQSAWAGDGATLIFRSGQVVLLENGYRQIVESMKSLSEAKDVTHRFITLDVGGGDFLLNLAEVTVVCRDTCRSLTVMHQLAPKRVESR